jgi:hypothetical protein
VPLLISISPSTLSVPTPRIQLQPLPYGGGGSLVETDANVPLGAGFRTANFQLSIAWLLRHCCRWTRVSSGLANLPTDWGQFQKFPSMQDFDGGGVTIPAHQRVAFYLHCPHPEDSTGDNAIAIRGPFTKGYVQGDVTDKDDFIKIHAGGCTNHPVTIALDLIHATHC